MFLLSVIYGLLVLCNFYHHGLGTSFNEFIMLESCEITDKTDATPVESQEDEILERTSDIPADIPIQVVIPTSQNPIIQGNNFNVQLENVSDERISFDLEENHSSILSLVKIKTPDISSIVAPEDAQIDPVLQKDIKFMQEWLSKAAAIEVPFTEVVSKSQKKKEFTEGSI